MTRVNLKKLIFKKGDSAFAIIELIQSFDPSVSIRDADGSVLFGAGNLTRQHPILSDDVTIGWVSGDSHGATLAALLTRLVGAESEKKLLANEVLGLYREINLLYNLSEKLAASLELATVAQTGLSKAHSLIQATHGAVLLLGEATRKLERVAVLGNVAPVRLDSVESILRHIADSGKAEVVNHVRSDPRHAELDQSIAALVCAPLRAKGQTIGAIVLMSETAVAYTAADLKLLNTLAALLGPAVESVLLHEKTLRDAKEREEKLHRQIEQLKIELDQALVTKQVSEITESDYFQKLSQHAKNLRRRSAGGATQQPGPATGE